MPAQHERKQDHDKAPKQGVATPNHSVYRQDACARQTETETDRKRYREREKERTRTKDEAREKDRARQRKKTTKEDY